MTDRGGLTPTLKNGGTLEPRKPTQVPESRPFPLRLLASNYQETRDTSFTEYRHRSLHLAVELAVAVLVSGNGYKLLVDVRILGSPYMK